MKSVFIIMPFGKTMEEKHHWQGVYTHIIKPVLHDLNYDVIRADEIGHQGNITANIVRLLWSSDLVIADLTTNNPNVFYELGIRHALRKHGTIMISQKGEKLPFDISNYQVSFYDTSIISVNEFKNDLKQRIIASENYKSSDNPVFDFLKDELKGLDEKYSNLENEIIDLTRGINITLQRLVALKEENIKLCVADNLIEMFTAAEGGFSERIAKIRFKLAMESNVILPHIRIKDDQDLLENVFVVYLNEKMILKETINPNYCYVIGDIKGYEDLVLTTTKIPLSNEKSYKIERSKAHLVDNVRNRIVFPADIIEHDLLLHFRKYVNNINDTMQDNLKSNTQ